MGSLGKAFFEICTGKGCLLQSSKGVSKHALEIEGAGGLIKRPECFRKVGIEFKQLTDAPLWNLIR